MMRWLENRIPPPLVMLTTLIVMGLISKLDSFKLLPVDIRGWGIAIGIFLAVIGVACSVLGVLSFRRAQTTVNPLQPEKASHLVSDGLFKFTRNPMYLGMLLVCLGWAFYLNSTWASSGVPAFVLFITRFQIVPEERAMIALFGAQFEHYKSRTRRWI